MPGIIWLAGLGAAFLVAAGALLVSQNLSSTVGLQLLSAVVVGTISFLLTFVATLKATEKEVTFVSSLVEDSRTHVPPMIATTTEPVAWRTEDSSFLMGTVFADKESRLVAIGPTVSENELQKIYVELLQYLAIKCLREHQSGPLNLTQIGGISGFRFTGAPALSDPTHVQRRTALEALAANRFAAADFAWQQGWFTAPKGSELVLSHHDGDLANGVPDTSTFEIISPRYLQFSVTIATTRPGDAGFVPKGVVPVRSEDGAFLRTRHFVVTAKYHLPWVTAGSWRTSENKAWADWALGELQACLKD